MSQRHRSLETAPPPKMDLRAHAHNERHRIHSELQAVTAQLSNGYEWDEVHEPGRAWVPLHHHDPERVRTSSGRVKHWKLKMWKRRTTVRRAKAQAFMMAGE
jgi:hypothetical protein